MKLNTSTNHFKLLILFFILASINCSLLQKPATNIQLPVLFSDNMVLQCDAKIPVWGAADPGGTVLVEIAGQRRKTTVSQNGEWRLYLRPITAGGPYKMLVVGRDSIVIHNVMIGEVWICSGQSNMEMALAGWGKIDNYRQEIANANYPDIRLFQVEHTTSIIPLDTIPCSGWDECSPATIPEFSSVAYFFGRTLHKELDVPVGLIHSSWGGTLAEAWTSACALKKMPDFKDKLDLIELPIDEYDEAMEKWNEDAKAGDAGFKNGAAVWNDPKIDAADWETMTLPTKWEDAGYPALDGFMWFRKEINLSSTMAASDLTLHLGPINDNDITWFNGAEVGSTSGADTPREYTIAKSLLRAGKNVIVVRVEDIGNTGGLWGEPDELYLEKSDGQKINLAGTWLCKIGFNTKELGPKPRSPHDPNRPTVLFNAMLHPIIPFAIQGAIWYQGESNAGRAHQYQTLFPTMIQDWRKRWRQGDFPFLFVQLANFMEKQTQPQDDAWAELREAQLKTLSLANTGMAVAIDIGDADDIHPKNKQEVGRRLALNALHLVYGQDIPFSGPIYKSSIIEGDKIRLTFDHVYKGLKTVDDAQLQGFTIAGADSVFHWAQAKFDGSDILVWNDDIKEPLAVRYAWAANPICNLYNSADLPASPFRTDSWKGITEGLK